MLSSVVSPAVCLLHFDQPGFGIGLFHFVDPQLAEIFFLENIQNEVVIRQGVMADIYF